MSDIFWVLFMFGSFCFGMTLGWLAGFDGWFVKKGKIKKAKDYEDLV